jgi:hypothetical protein
MMAATTAHTSNESKPSGRRLDAAQCIAEAKMAWRQNRWVRRWVWLIVFWAVPVAIVAVREIKEEMAYNVVDLERALTTWQFTDAQRATGAPLRCHGKPEEARAAGCPVDVLDANAPRQQEALAEYALRRSTLANYLWHAFVGYWVVPAAFVFAVGVLIAGIRRALRRPPVVKRSVHQ